MINTLQELLDLERARLRWFDVVNYQRRYMLEIVKQRKDIVATIKSLEERVVQECNEAGGC